MRPVTIGVVDGGGPAGAAWLPSLRRLTLLVSDESRPVDSASSVNIVFFLDGNNYPLDFSGMRIGKVDTARAKVMVRVALPPTVPPEPLRALTVAGVEAAHLAGAHARRRGLDDGFETAAVEIFGRVGT